MVIILVIINIVRINDIYASNTKRGFSIFIITEIIKVLNDWINPKVIYS